jgi:hypothetical protein
MSKMVRHGKATWRGFWTQLAPGAASTRRTGHPSIAKGFVTGNRIHGMVVTGPIELSSLVSIIGAGIYKCLGLRSGELQNNAEIGFTWTVF